MSKNILVILLISIGAKSFSQQDKGIISLNYALAPTGNNDMDYKETGIKASVKMKNGNINITNTLKANGYFFNGATEEAVMMFDASSFYKLSYSPKVGYDLSKQWTVGGYIDAGLSSDLKNKITTEDLIFIYGLHLKYSLDNEESIFRSFSIGAIYDTYLGEQQYLPFVSSKFELNEQLRFSLGFPYSDINYLINDHSSLSGSYRYEGEYFAYSNNAHAALEKATASIKYNYLLDPHWGISFSTGYLFKNDLTITDNNNQNQSYKNSGMVFSTSLKFKL